MLTTHCVCNYLRGIPQANLINAQETLEGTVMLSLE